MFSGSTLPPGLIKAYGETHYKVVGNPGFALLVGCRNAGLAIAHEEHDVACSAFITACNPFSRRLSSEENAHRQRFLASELRENRLSFVDGVGCHPSNDWEGESSFLVFGLDLSAAKAISKRFEQNAFVWSGVDATPQLILLQ